MKHDEEPTDLLGEARRRPLSRDEEARLEELVASSPEARILHYAGWSFDRDSSAREDDDVLVARLAARAAERMANPGATLPVRRRRRPFVTLLAAALAVASTAGAGAAFALSGYRLAAAAGAALTPGLPEGVGTVATMEALPGKKPLIKLSYRPPNYESPLETFRNPITPKREASRAGSTRMSRSSTPSTSRPPTRGTTSPRSRRVR